MEDKQELLDAIAEMRRQGLSRIEAIKAVYVRFGGGLNEAKEAVWMHPAYGEANPAAQNQDAPPGSG